MKEIQQVTRVVLFTPSGVLLHERPDWSKQAPKELQLPGGKKEKTDKSAEKAILREIREEFSLTELAFLWFMNRYENNTPKTTYQTYVFVGRTEQEPQFNETNNGKMVLIPYETLGETALAFDHSTMVADTQRILSHDEIQKIWR